jgi:hypothetical protein
VAVGGDNLDKRELVAELSKKLKIENSVAESAVNETVAELVAPYVFKRPGDEQGFILDNSCSNNCKEPAAVSTPSTPSIRTAINR